MLVRLIPKKTKLPNNQPANNTQSVLRLLSCSKLRLLRQYEIFSSKISFTPVIAGVIIFVAVSMLIDTVYTEVRLQSPLPYFDEWDSLSLFKELVTRKVPWTEIFSQHNEHRIFFPRLILFSDYWFFGGRGLLDRIAILFIQATHIGLLIWLVQRSRPSTAGRLTVAAVIVILLSSLRQEENFSWNFQVSFVAVFAVATLACILFSYALARSSRGLPSLTYYVGAYSCAIVATYTMANGLIVPAILFSLAVATRAKLTIIVSAALVMVVLAAAYLQGYEVPPQHTPYSFSIHHPLRFFGYLAAYIGNFLDPDLWPALLLGLWGLLTFTIAAWRVVVLRDRDPVRLALFGVMTFAIVSALITSLGRVGFGIEQAFASRYSTGSGTFWSASLVFWWSLANARKLGLVLRGSIGLTALVLITGAISAQGDMKDGMVARAYQQQEATDALLLGLNDPDSFGEVDSDSRSILEGAAFLKSRGLSVFDGGDAMLVGHLIGDAGGLVGGDACMGSILTADLMPNLGENGSRVSGKVWPRQGHRLTDKIYLTDGNAKIVGLATRGLSQEDSSSWHGFANSPPGTTLYAFVRLRGSALCPMGQFSIAQ